MTDANLFLLIQGLNYTHTDADIDYTFYTEGTTLYMLFQETRSKNDWKINFDFPARMYKNMIVHRGYANAFKQAKSELWNALKDKLVAGNYTEVVFSGWSKGSFEAILMAEEYYYQTKKKPYCITYGGPKVCYTIGTRNYLRKNIFIKEYVNTNDLVTKVIPFCFRINKVKVGGPFKIKKLIKVGYYHCNYDVFIL